MAISSGEKNGEFTDYVYKQLDMIIDIWVCLKMGHIHIRYVEHDDQLLDFGIFGIFRQTLDGLCIDLGSGATLLLVENRKPKQSPCEDQTQLFNSSVQFCWVCAPKKDQQGLWHWVYHGLPHWA